MFIVWWRNYDVIVNCMVGKSEFSTLLVSQADRPINQAAPPGGHSGSSIMHCIKVRAPGIKFAMVTDDFFLQPGTY